MGQRHLHRARRHPGDPRRRIREPLILHDQYSALIDPGGALLYTPVSLALGHYLPLRSLTWILASHQDPDVIGSADRWLMYSDATIACSTLWGRFVPHSVPHYVDTGRLLIPGAHPDHGGLPPSLHGQQPRLRGLGRHGSGAWTSR